MKKFLFVFSAIVLIVALSAVIPQTSEAVDLSGYNAQSIYGSAGGPGTSTLDFDAMSVIQGEASNFFNTVELYGGGDISNHGVVDFGFIASGGDHYESGFGYASPWVAIASASTASNTYSLVIGSGYNVSDIETYMSVYAGW